MMRQLCAALITIATLSLHQLLQAAPVTVINPGGEVYPTGPNTEIDPGGLAPLTDTGWNSTATSTLGEEGVEGINNQVDPTVGGNIRLAFGAVNADPAIDDDTNQASDFVLFQQTSAVVQANDLITMDWIGRAFFQFDVGSDFQTSLFGYLDGGGSLVSVDTEQHPSTIGGVWTPATHSYLVPAGSPLIGEQLTIGFYTDTPDQASGGFTAVDNVALDVTAVPEPASLLLGLAGISSAGFLRRRR